MDYQKPVAAVVAEYNTGAYSEIETLYNLLIDNATPPDYIFSEVCMSYIFNQQQYGSCTVADMDAVFDILNTYTSDNKILAYTLFGYKVPYNLTDCDDNGICSCGYDLPNERNISSQRLFGVLTDDNYLSKLYSRNYLMQVTYKEDTNKLIFSAENSVVDPPYDTGSFYQMYSSYYRNKLTVSYLSFDRDTAKFAEQIILDGAHKDNKIWEYEVGTFDCFHHSEEPCVSEMEDYTNLTEYVHYIGQSGVLSLQAFTTPIIYTTRLNYEDNKPKIDGLYKSYYFLFPYLTEILTNETGSMAVSENSMFYFAYTDEEGNVVEEYCYSKNNLLIVFTHPNAIQVSNQDEQISTIFDLTTNEGRIAFKEAYFESLTGFDLLNRIQYIPNLLRSNLYSSYDTFIGEDAHLVTYELRNNIIESIKDCNIPCEKFSLDTWVALKQKKSAASVLFCQKNFTEVSRLLTTVEERCKNCD